MYYISVYIYIFESKDESQMNLIEKFEFESNQMVIELEIEFKPCDLVHYRLLYYNECKGTFGKTTTIRRKAHEKPTTQFQT